MCKNTIFHWYNKINVALFSLYFHLISDIIKVRNFETLEIAHLQYYIPKFLIIMEPFNL